MATFQGARGVYRFSVVAAIVSVAMAAVAFQHDDIGPGVCLLVWAIMTGIQAMVASHDVDMLARRPDPPDSTRPPPQG